MTRAHKQTNTQLTSIGADCYLGRKSRSWSRTSLLRWVARVARRVAGVMPWVSWVALLSRIAGIAGVAPAIRGSWRALQHIQ